jgi:hypothetical protein
VSEQRIGLVSNLLLSKPLAKKSRNVRLNEKPRADQNVGLADHFRKMLDRVPWYCFAGRSLVLREHKTEALSCRESNPQSGIQTRIRALAFSAFGLRVACRGIHIK